MQAGGRGVVRPPVGIVFEGDVGRRLDAVLAQALLHGLAGKGECRAVAIAVSRPSLASARLADVVASFYNGRPAAGFTTVGMPEAGAGDDDAPLASILDSPAGRAPVHTSNIQRLLDTADNAVHMRNVLLAQHDGNAAIVVAGPLTGLARLLSLYGAVPQVSAKARLLVVAAGQFGAGAADPAIRADLASARRVFAEWPTPIVVVGGEVGLAAPYPASSIERDFAWSATHPVVDVYRSAQQVPPDAPASALAAVLHAVQPAGDLFKLSDAGTVTVQDDGRTTHTARTDGRHRYLMVDPSARERVIARYVELVSAPPPPRPGRGRGAGPPPAQQQAAPAAAPVAPPAAPPVAAPPARPETPRP